MAIRKLKNGGRRKAIFGSQEAAILAAAGIGAAATYGAAAIGAKATKDQANASAKATIKGAQDQARAIKDQSVKAKEQQEEAQEFIKEENAQNRELQKDMQMMLQLAMGQQNVNDRLEASKIQVKNGGQTRRKLRLAGNTQSSLQGSNNMPFVVTDGGGVIPVGQTAEGYDVYEIRGNDHEHYHKTRGGKNKTGVGIKFADGNVIEGEGNQNTSQGEVMINTPDNAYFLSKHSIAGFNPVKMIKDGMHPLQAYAIQEQLKAANGISDDGKHNSSPIEKKLLGGQPNPIYDMNNQVGPQMGVDTSADTVVGTVYELNNDNQKRSLKCGGNVRRKAIGGAQTTGLAGPNFRGFAAYNFNQKPNIPKINIGRIGSNVGRWLGNAASSVGKWALKNADTVGAGIQALGNIGGALVTASANRDAADILANAQTQAAGVMRDAYNSLTGIDMNSIRREDYAAAHMMPTFRAVMSHSAQPLSSVDRSLHRQLSNAGKYSASSAAAQDRMAAAEVTAQDTRNQIYNADEQQKQEIRNKNVESANEAAKVNAMLESEANKEYANAYMDALEYNADVKNQKILGAAGATAEGLISSASTRSKARTSNAAAWASALTGSAQSYANSLSNMITRKADLEKVLLGANSDSQASYYANYKGISDSEAKAAYDRLVAQYNIVKDSDDAGDKDTATRLRRQINNIASGRGFKMV